MCRREMLDVANSHSVKKKVTDSFGSAEGGERVGGEGGQKPGREGERQTGAGCRSGGLGGGERKLREKIRREEERMRGKGKSGESLETPQQHSWKRDVGGVRLGLD